MKWQKPQSLTDIRQSIGGKIGTISYQTIHRQIDIVFHRTVTVLRKILFHGYSLWLFTASDLKTIVGPSLIFGVTNALASRNYGIELPGLDPSKKINGRIPLVVLWIWMNLLPFTINNQKSPGAIEEDKINKPWRTLPAGRMTPRQAERLMLIFYLLAMVLTWVTGGVRQSVGLVILGIWYNNFAGGDDSPIIRNTINAYGYVCFTSGAMEVALGIPLPWEVRLLRWFSILGTIVFTTVHLQDMYDQTGDAMKGRNTVPLVVGDGLARWSIASAMIFWGFVCPCYWEAGMVTLLLSIVLANIVGARSLLFRTANSDRLTFKIWNAWMTLVFVLPLMSQICGPHRSEYR